MQIVVFAVLKALSDGERAHTAGRGAGVRSERADVRVNERAGKDG